MRQINIERDHVSPIQSNDFINAANKFNTALRELQLARIQESIEFCECLLKVANHVRESDDKNGTINPLYYPVVDRCGVMIEQLNEVKKYI